MAAFINVREKLEQLALERILVLDGAMGALIQAYRTPLGQPLGEDDFRGIAGPEGERFGAHPVPLKGCNDLLCLTRPALISGIHEDYLKAGADIIETCSFNATAVSLADYGLEDLAYEISAAAARLARNAADAFSSPDKPRFVAGSMGPTGKSAGLSHDMDNPGKRAVSWDELEAAYYDNARGLLDGGADLLIIETVFDTLNAKAAIFAVRRLADERNIDVPLIISATVLNNGGRLLSGQSVEAFCVSVLHANPLALGLNCSFGAEKLKAHVAVVSAAVPCLVSAHPNAGLPNRLGAYDESPESMADYIEEYFKNGLVNIIGGCCGSTPAHIAAIAGRAKKYAPRPLPKLPKKTLLAGLEVLEVSRERGLTNIGERTNVAGSRKFLKLIKEENYEEAVDIARNMAEAGASVIDVCMDDALLDAKAAMKNFLNLALVFPDLARLPVMIDSSRWEVIEAGLKCLPGKGLINSISLKEGEEEFFRKARLARSYGAAIVVMLFDETGQALSYEHRIAAASRSWKLLLDSGFPPEDIVFDPNVLAAGTGIPEHDLYAADFIRTCAWIRDNCPGAQISGGISNLSFSFRGNNQIREAMHSVFIKHAVEQGLSMAIVNPAALVPYDEIDGELRQAVTDLILYREPRENENAAPGPAEKLLALAEAYSSAAPRGTAGIVPGRGIKEKDTAWRGLPVEDRITLAMLRGIDDYIASDIEELKRKYRPLEIVEGPLLKGIREVGERFGAGGMFLPQVIRAARIMKKAVALLEPFLENEKSLSGESPARTKVLMATVKGDVHDIGKNIAALVLACNGCEIIDLGVMVQAEQILEKAKAEKADIIGLSGLISPSLDEMIHVAREMERQGFTIPLLVGGAAASLAHTALRIAPLYSGPVVYVPDASRAPAAVRALVSETGRVGFLEELKVSYGKALERHDSIQKNRKLLPLEEARKNRVSLSRPAPEEFPGAKDTLNLSEILGYPPGSETSGEVITLNDYPLNRVIPHIDWTSLVQTWDLAANTYPSAYEAASPAEAKKTLEKLLEDAKILLENIASRGILRLRGVVGFFPAFSEGDDIIILEPSMPAGKEAGASFREAARFVFPRNQEKKRGGEPNPCLSDFIPGRELPEKNKSAPGPAGQVGLFALSAGFGFREAEEDFRSRNDDYGAFLLAGLANSLAEAFSEEVHRRLRRYWGGGGIRPAFGYPACPDHHDKEIVFGLLDAQKRSGLELTETAMIIPAASVCGMYLAHPDSFYFGVGMIGDDQLNDWAGRKGISPEEARKRLGGL